MTVRQLNAGNWLNPPAIYTQSDEELTLETGSQTDFWRDTLYGFRRDNGHAFLTGVDGDFTAYLMFKGDFQALYDQAGLMLRQDEAHWIKAGIEVSDGMLNMSVVVTRQTSDWSTFALPTSDQSHRLRITRKGATVIVQFRNVRSRWQLLRVANFPEGPAQLGPMACSPQRSQLRVTFTEFHVTPPVEQALHDETIA
jgi:uncharacterized protein